MFQVFKVSLPRFFVRKKEANKALNTWNNGKSSSQLRQCSGGIEGDEVQLGDYGAGGWYDGGVLGERGRLGEFDQSKGSTGSGEESAAGEHRSRGWRIPAIGNVAGVSTWGDILERLHARLIHWDVMTPNNETQWRRLAWAFYLLYRTLRTKTDVRRNGQQMATNFVDSLYGIRQQFD